MSGLLPVTEDRTFNRVIQYESAGSIPGTRGQSTTCPHCYTSTSTSHHFRIHHRQSFFAVDCQSHGQTSAILWRGGGVQRFSPTMLTLCNLISIPRKDLKSPSSFHSFLAKHCSGQRRSGLKPVILPNHSITLFLISERSLDGHTVIPPQVISFITSGSGLSPSRSMHWGSERSRLPAVGMNAHWSPLTAKD